MIPLDLGFASTSQHWEGVFASRWNRGLGAEHTLGKNSSYLGSCFIGFPYPHWSEPSKTVRQTQGMGQSHLSHEKVNGVHTKLTLAPTRRSRLAKHSFLFSRGLIPFFQRKWKALVPKKV